MTWTAHLCTDQSQDRLCPANISGKHCQYSWLYSSLYSSYVAGLAYQRLFANDVSLSLLVYLNLITVLLLV